MIQLLSIPRFLLQALVAAPSTGASDQGFSALMAEAAEVPVAEPEAPGPLPAPPDSALHEEAKRRVQSAALLEPGLQARPVDRPAELPPKQREKPAVAGADPGLPLKQPMPAAIADKDTGPRRDEQISDTATPSSEVMLPPLLPQNALAPPRAPSFALDQGPLQPASHQQSFSPATSGHTTEIINDLPKPVANQPRQVLADFVQTADAEPAVPGALSPDMVEILRSEEPNSAGQNLPSGLSAGQLSVDFAAYQNRATTTVPGASMLNSAAIAADRRGESPPPTPAYGSFRVTAEAIGPLAATAAIPAQVFVLSDLDSTSPAAPPVLTAAAAPIALAQAATLLGTRPPRPALSTDSGSIESADAAQDMAAPANPTPLRGIGETNAITPLRATAPATLPAQILQHAAEAQMRQVEVMLAPEELGRLKFQIRHHGEAVSVFLSAERADTLDMLRRNGEDLLREFRQAGFSGASLEFGAWGQGQSHQDQPPFGFAQPDDFTSVLAIARPTLMALLPAAAGGLNLRL